MFEHLKNKKLYRSPKDALVFGVAAGLGHYLQVDVVFVRLVLVVLMFLTGWWLMPVAYVIALIIMPIEPSQETVAPTQEPKDVTEHMDRDQNA